MTILQVLEIPDPRLRKKAVPVSDFGDDFQKIIDDMIDTLMSAENCGAYAATQLNIHKRVTIIHPNSAMQAKPLILVNPEITYREGEVFEEEGCMSVPGGIYEKVKRAAMVKARAQDRFGNDIALQHDGYLGRCIQHEIDHLNGVLFIDHLSSIKRARALKKLEKFRKEK